MAKIKRITIKAKKRRFHAPGTSPGQIGISDTALEPKITLHSFNAEEYLTADIKNVKQLDEQLEKHQTLTHWIDIKGLGSLKLFEYIETRFGIHKLVMEDIVNTDQRPKLDEYDDYLFSVSRMLYINDGLEIENEQMSFLLMENVLISFQENYNDCLQSVTGRLKGGKGPIRSSGPSYIMYTLMDVIIDNYFNLIYKMGEELDIIEELLYRKPDKSIMFKTHEIKRAMILIRRSAWPERDKINDMIRSASPLISDTTKLF